MVSGISRVHFVCLTIIALWSACVSTGAAQGTQPVPGDTTFSFPGLNHTASNPLALPRGGSGQAESSSLFLNERLLQGIVQTPPHFRFGYLYDGGNKFSAGRLTLDAFMPVGLSRRTRFFGEGHASFQDFWRTIGGQSNNRVDLSFGGGVRQILGDTRYVGVNAFYDTTRLGGRWFSSGGFGLELWGNLAGSDSIDLSFNYYGDLFSGPNTIVNAFRRGKGNFDIEAGYSKPLLNESLDLRLKVRGYQFNSGDNIYGWAAGADLSTNDRLLSLRYEVAQDKLNGTYHTVGGFVSVGFDLGNLVAFENPFVRRRPIYGSPPNPYTEADNKEVHRQFWGPGEQSQVVLANQASGCLFFRTIGLHSFPYTLLIIDDNQLFAPVDHTAITTLDVTITYTGFDNAEPLGLQLNDAVGTPLAVIVIGGTFTDSTTTTTVTFTVPVAGLVADPAQLDLFTSGGSAGTISWSATLCFH